MNYKLVKFEDGTYGVRKGLIFFRFKDFVNNNHFWWRMGNGYFRDCKTTEEKARRFLDNPKEYTIIK